MSGSGGGEVEGDRAEMRVSMSRAINGDPSIIPALRIRLCLGFLAGSGVESALGIGVGR